MCFFRDMPLHVVQDMADRWKRTAQAASRNPHQSQGSQRSEQSVQSRLPLQGPTVTLVPRTLCSSAAASSAAPDPKQMALRAKAPAVPKALRATSKAKALAVPKALRAKALEQKNRACSILLRLLLVLPHLLLQKLRRLLFRSGCLRKKRRPRHRPRRPRSPRGGRNGPCRLGSPSHCRSLLYTRPLLG